MRRYVHALQRMINIFGEMPDTRGEHLYPRSLCRCRGGSTNGGPNRIVSARIRSARTVD